jgi:hypothetical protein
MTEKSAYHQFSQVQPPSSHLIPHSQIQSQVTPRCLHPPLKPWGFPVINLDLSTAASPGFQRREGYQGAGTQHLTIRSYDMMRIISKTGTSHFLYVASLPLHTPCAVLTRAQIDGTLYCVHRYFFSRDSVHFSTRFAQLGLRDHEALPTIISIGDVERNDFEALLSVLYPV